MRELIKAWLKMDEKERDSILLNEIAMLYEEVDRLKQIIENMTSDNAQS
jgi:hypothetical protein